MAFLSNTDPKKAPYIHQDFPKHINFPDGKYKVANDADEEKLIREEFQEQLAGKASHSSRIEDEPKKGKDSPKESEAVKKAERARIILLKTAQTLGIEVKEGWDIDKINDAIEKALAAAETADEGGNDKRK